MSLTIKSLNNAMEYLLDSGLISKEERKIISDCKKEVGSAKRQQS